VVVVCGYIARIAYASVAEIPDIPKHFEEDVCFVA
jgi:hypothetical protein